MWAVKVRKCAKEARALRRAIMKVLVRGLRQAKTTKDRRKNPIAIKKMSTRNRKSSLAKRVPNGMKNWSNMAFAAASRR